MPAISIVQANLDDHEHQNAIVRLTQAYACDVMGGGEPLTNDVMDRLIAGLQDMPTAIIFLAYAGERAVGIATCFQGFSTFLAKRLINVHDLAVLPEYRGQGVGRKLLEAVEVKGLELGCGKLTLEVQGRNFTAQRLYQKAGYNAGTCGETNGEIFFYVKYLPG